MMTIITLRIRTGQYLGYVLQSRYCLLRLFLPQFRRFHPPSCSVNRSPLPILLLIAGHCRVRCGQTLSSAIQAALPDAQIQSEILIWKAQGDRKGNTSLRVVCLNHLCLDLVLPLLPLPQQQQRHNQTSAKQQNEAFITLVTPGIPSHSSDSI